jgi:hypothetical protein
MAMPSKEPKLGPAPSTHHAHEHQDEEGCAQPGACVSDACAEPEEEAAHDKADDYDLGAGSGEGQEAKASA